MIMIEVGIANPIPDFFLPTYTSIIPITINNDEKTTKMLYAYKTDNTNASRNRSLIASEYNITSKPIAMNTIINNNTDINM
jgi:hypothetical protein